MALEQDRKHIPYSTDSCPACVRMAMEEELKAIGRIETPAERAEIAAWERKHTVLKLLAFAVFLALMRYLWMQ